MCVFHYRLTESQEPDNKRPGYFVGNQLWALEQWFPDDPAKRDQGVRLRLRLRFLGGYYKERQMGENTRLRGEGGSHDETRNEDQDPGSRFLRDRG